MALYITLIKKSFLQRFTYRFNSYFTIISTIIGLFVMISVWSNLYNHDSEVNGVQFNHIITFVFINSLVRVLINSSIHTTLGSKVEDGSISLDFIKPVKLKYYLFANQFGDNIFRLVFNAIPAGIFVIFFWDIETPDNIITFLLFIVSLVNGILISFLIDYLLGISIFWFKSSFFMDWVSRALLQIFAGTSVPLWFYPDSLLLICNYLPFRFITFEPISIFIGKTSTYNALYTILLQWGWILAFVLLERLLWKKAQKIIDINGG